MTHHQVIKTTKALTPVGSYNQAIAARGQFLFVSWQIPLNPETGDIVQQTQ